MIPLSHTLVTLKPACQAALQAIMTVENPVAVGRVCPLCHMCALFTRAERQHAGLTQRWHGVFLA
ncbi:hypothetical protein DOH12_23835 [Salmonella enterica subsp. enterica]|nr:hypothetical protein [Salmonella enterica subsp. enterica serovar Sandiego]